jgi:hypothetical protein
MSTRISSEAIDTLVVRTAVAASTLAVDHQGAQLERVRRNATKSASILATAASVVALYDLTLFARIGH